MNLCKSILVAEDNDDVREAIVEALSAEGFTVAEAKNGQEALEKLEKMPEPTLVLLDLMMPVMSGYELLQALRANDDLASIPVTVVSAVGDRLAAGTSVLRKPVDLETLLNAVDATCRQVS